MPRVSDEHRSRRREQILSAARRCFVRDGFHATSMQDLFAEAELSAGAVYGHFAAKDDVIIAIAEENLQLVTTMIDALAEPPEDRSLGETLARMLEIAATNHHRSGDGAIALLVWAEAMRNPTLAARVGALIQKLRDDLTDAARAAQRAGQLPSGVSPDSLGTILMAIVPGCLMQSALLGPDAVAGAADALRALWGDQPAPRRR